jgi:hypothetical protein
MFIAIGLVARSTTNPYTDKPPAMMHIVTITTTITKTKMGENFLVLILGNFSRWVWDFVPAQNLTAGLLKSQLLQSLLYTRLVLLPEQVLPEPVIVSP